MDVRACDLRFIIFLPRYIFTCEINNENTNYSDADKVHKKILYVYTVNNNAELYAEY